MSGTALSGLSFGELKCCVRDSERAGRIGASRLAEEFMRTTSPEVRTFTFSVGRLRAGWRYSSAVTAGFSRRQEPNHLRTTVALSHAIRAERPVMNTLGNL